MIDGQRPAADVALLTRLGQHCSDLEQRAVKAERELTKLKLINFLQLLGKKVKIYLPYLVAMRKVYLLMIL